MAYFICHVVLQYMTDPKCGPDGVLRDYVPSGGPVPNPVVENAEPLRITNIVELNISIGRVESGTLRI